MHVSDSQNHIISHNPATHQVPPVTHIQKPKMPIIILAVLGLILVGIGAAWYFNDQSFDFIKDKDEEFVVEPVDDTVIATVGAESVYAEDLNYKLSSFPQSKHAELEADFKKQLIEESIILQAGADANYIELSADVFNTLSKNQQQRSQLVEQVKTAVNNQAANIQGAYVTIWFMNYKPGSIGYDAGQTLAFEKISALHQAVISGQITIKQAGEAIQQDTTLAQVDPQYKSNAYVEFNSKDKSGGLTFQPTFDQELLGLKVGETTDIFLGQDYEESDFTQPQKDALYMFGQITDRQTDGGQTFDEWLVTLKENYEVTLL